MSKYTLLVTKQTKERSIRNNKTGEVIRELENPAKYAELRKKAVQNIKAAQRHELMLDCGLTRVYGTVSGKVYYE
jgi:hypothetical protein